MRRMMIACDADNMHSVITSRSADATEGDRSRDLIEVKMQHDRLTRVHTRMEGDKEYQTSACSGVGVFQFFTYLMVMHH